MLVVVGAISSVMLAVVGAISGSSSVMLAVVGAISGSSSVMLGVVGGYVAPVYTCYLMMLLDSTSIFALSGLQSLSWIFK